MLVSIKKEKKISKASSERLNVINQVRGRGGFIFFDKNRLDQISDTNGQSRKDLLSVFVQEMPGIISNVDIAFQEGNAALLGQQMHQMKSSVSWICVRSIIGYIQRMEMMKPIALSPRYKIELDMLLASIRILVDEARMAMLECVH